ncbi:hypothetical protein AAIR98_000177 [Elusimicrobium simillimum]|uniref:DUF4846 domain-containing protein n=1 Tax=Elusimicrobium simillimum TaxID=3143438 RepID=UPI003C6F3781
MKKLLSIIFCVFICFACNAENGSGLTDTKGNTIATRFAPPAGFTRTAESQNSFAAYLRNLPLKKDGALVKYFNGKTKPNLSTYVAVVDMEISPKDLQQCADAVMRLYGEYQFAENKINDIKFNFVSDGKPRYFKDYAKGDTSYKNFRKYMDYVFAYANTASLLNQLRPVKDINDMKIGDVFIQKGRPFGHAVIVVDMAQNKEGKKVYMLAQSYMPAQETQVLFNPMNVKLSPWYDLNGKTIVTPEWVFQPADLRRF